MNNFGTKNSYSRLILFTFSVILNLLISLYIAKFVGNEISWMFRLSILSLFQIIINIVILKKMGENVFSLSILFLLFSLIFHLGQVLIFGFSLEANIPINVLDRIPMEMLREAAIYTVIIHSFLSLGMQSVFLFMNKKNVKKVDNIVLNNDLKLMRKIGKVLILIGIIPTLYIDINRIIIFISQGYIATYTLFINSAVTTIAKSFELGLLILMIGNNKNSKIARNILFFTLFYYSIGMISGHRGWAIVFILTMIYFYIYTTHKVSVKDYFKFGIIGYVILVMINTIGDFRHYIQPTLDDFIVMISKNIGSPILDSIGEFGGTMVTLGLSIQYFPTYAPIQYGTNYLQSLLLVFPNIGGVLNNITSSITYTNHFPEYARKSLGGSYIGELFFSFNSVGFVFAILIGILVAGISIKFKKLIMEESYLKMNYYLILFPSLLWWVRGYFSGLVRDFLWLGMMIFIVEMVCRRKTNLRFNNLK